MKKYIAIILSLFLMSCATFNDQYSEQYHDQLSMRLPNDCVLDASIKDSALSGCKKLDGTEIWHKPLVSVFIYQGKKLGHAMCIFEVRGRLWGYDSRGSILLETRDKTDALAIAKELLPGAEVLEAWFLEQE
jgi:hypothetical protein